MANNSEPKYTIGTILRVGHDYANLVRPYSYYKLGDEFIVMKVIPYSVGDSRYYFYVVYSKKDKSVINLTRLSVENMQSVGSVNPETLKLLWGDAEHGFDASLPNLTATNPKGLTKK